MTFTTNGRQKSRTDNKMARGLVTLSLSVVIVELLFFYFWCQTPNINTANNELANENNEKEMAETIMPCQSDRQTDMPGAQLRLHSAPFCPLIEGIKTRWAAGERAQMQATPRRQRRDGTHTASNPSSLLPPPLPTQFVVRQDLCKNLKLKFACEAHYWSSFQRIANSWALKAKESLSVVYVMHN